ncbi:hypothetical protein [Komagataeibacter xylinus]|uniref:Uncharacterized protein n=1 Tax=Komagataeibacter xylinus TaxID=28448 RepID=A0A857FRE6_KOMXY|nr:hypothetical protein [Komagataeibacter xylinus]QHC36726.1 hypothetical protein FMA36_15500 [Komagataeibacter xylinus]
MLDRAGDQQPASVTQDPQTRGHLPSAILNVWNPTRKDWEAADTLNSCDTQGMTCHQLMGPGNTTVIVMFRTHEGAPAICHGATARQYRRIHPRQLYVEHHTDGPACLTRQHHA